MNKIWLIILCFAAGCATRDGFYPAPRHEDNTVSLVRLLANPKSCHGKTVVVAGYLHLEHESDLLYLHEEDFSQHLRTNAVWIDVPKNAPSSFAATFSGRYVMVKGTFDATRAGFTGLPAGALTDVTDVMTWGKGPMKTWPESKVDPNSKDPFAAQ